jgi:hypothetical protein
VHRIPRGCREPTVPPIMSGAVNWNHNILTICVKQVSEIRAWTNNQPIAQKAQILGRFSYRYARRQDEGQRCFSSASTSEVDRPRQSDWVWGRGQREALRGLGDWSGICFRPHLFKKESSAHRRICYP